jgi:hypothetical protein
MSLVDCILVVAALLLPLCAYPFLRRMRTMQRDEIEARDDRFYQEMLEELPPEGREELLRSETDADSTSKPD